MNPEKIEDFATQYAKHPHLVKYHTRKMIGLRYGKLTIQYETVPEFWIGPNQQTQSRRWFICACECGEQARVRLPDLLDGSQTSCGCSHESQDPIYQLMKRAIRDSQKEKNNAPVSK